jgi:hypothetical protein
LKKYNLTLLAILISSLSFSQDVLEKFYTRKILYVGIDNPIKVAVAGYSDSVIIAKTNNGTCRAINKDNGEWIVTPTVLGAKTTIDLYASLGYIWWSTNEGYDSLDLNGNKVLKQEIIELVGSLNFKVIDIPPPIACVEGIPLGTKTISRDELRSAQGLKAYMGSDFLLDPKKVVLGVESYRVQYTTANGTVNKQVYGRAFDDVVKNGIERVADGGTITFSDIKVRRTGYGSAFMVKYSLIFIVK